MVINCWLCYLKFLLLDSLSKVPTVEIKQIVVLRLVPVSFLKDLSNGLRLVAVNQRRRFFAHGNSVKEKKYEF